MRQTLGSTRTTHLRASAAFAGTVLGMSLIGAGMLGGCSTNPATGRSQLAFYGRDWDIDVGEQAAPGMVQEFGGEVKSADLRAYVTDIGTRLARHTEADNPSLPWSFTLLDSDVINAFALPGGKVFFSRGLAEKMTNEAQMAGVLGHEVGHVTARHTAERISKAAVVQGLVQAAGVAASSYGGGVEQALPAVQVGGELITLKFSRDQESEADSLGMRYMVKEKYNPAAMVQVMEILKAASGEAGNEWTATHPLPETRIQRIQTEIQTTYSYTQNNAEFKLDESRFKSAFLAKLAQLPPAPDAGARGTGRWLAINLDEPATWCEHCRNDKGNSHR
ncbi:MAG: M48 family metalloprotease [Phycisphaerales bacterium]|nr:M48 family metalloprotease [Phycisphaerales bacterium]